MKIPPMFKTDGYKLGHRPMFPEGTTRIYSNATPRGSRVEGQDSVISFGIQYAIQEHLMNQMYDNFFDRSLTQVTSEYKNFCDNYLGPDNIVGIDHIAALHELGYLPIQICAVPEGTQIPLRVPMFTIENTHDDFFWLTNYLETLLASTTWLPVTSATTAFRYRRVLERYALKTGGPIDFVDWQAHDFSARGMTSPEAAAASGAGHLLFFAGTDTLAAIWFAQEYYDAGDFVGGSVPATEHAVMCAGGKMSERETFERLMNLHPTGIISVVSDTWDLWKVLTEILPSIKDHIMARDGKLVIRPDSGDPADILCGDPNAVIDTPERKGVIQLLWEHFGGTVNSQGYKELDSHIGAIYGDSITLERCEEICSRLATRGFASTNVVLGIGSFTYTYVTRDTYGQAIKATWAMVNGEERFLEKDPITDSGLKKSATGRLAVLETEDGIILNDGLTLAGWEAMKNEPKNILRPIWENGNWLRRDDFHAIRNRAHHALGV